MNNLKKQKNVRSEASVRKEVKWAQKISPAALFLPNQNTIIRYGKSTMKFNSKTRLTCKVKFSWNFTQMQFEQGLHEMNSSPLDVGQSLKIKHPQTNPERKLSAETDQEIMG